MSEETEDHNDGTWTGLKKTIIGLLTTAVLGAGGVMTSKFLGGEEEVATPTQQQTPIIINNNNQQQQHHHRKNQEIRQCKTIGHPGTNTSSNNHVYPNNQVKVGHEMNLPFESVVINEVG